MHQVAKLAVSLAQGFVGLILQADIVLVRLLQGQHGGAVLRFHIGTQFCWFGDADQAGLVVEIGQLFAQIDNPGELDLFRIRRVGCFNGGLKRFNLGITLCDFLAESFGDTGFEVMVGGDLFGIYPDACPGPAQRGGVTHGAAKG